VNATQYEEFEMKLLDIINPVEDSLRIYRITEPVEMHIKEFGHFKAIDFENDPLIL
jgi:CRISPR-associated protein Cas2